MANGEKVRRIKNKSKTKKVQCTLCLLCLLVWYLQKKRMRGKVTNKTGPDDATPCKEILQIQSNPLNDMIPKTERIYPQEKNRAESGPFASCLFV